MKRTVLFLALLILVACLCLAFASCGCSDEEETLQPSKGLEYALSDDGEWYTVTGIGTCTDKNLVIPSEYDSLPVRSIGKSAFENCDTVRNVVISHGITSIEEKAFALSIIASIEIPNSVTDIGEKVFESCKSLASVEIPESVTNIGKNAFNNCARLSAVVMNNGVKTIGEEAFSNNLKLRYINIPKSVTSIGEDAFLGCSNLMMIDVDENNEHYKSIDGNLYTKDGKELIKCVMGNVSGELVLPSDLEVIHSKAFLDCVCLTSVVIPRSVKTIGEKAFYGCLSLTIYCEPAIEHCEWYYQNWNSISEGLRCPTAYRYEKYPDADGCYYVVIDGIRYGIKGDEAFVARQSCYVTEAEIKSEITYRNEVYPVTAIDVAAFSLCSNLTRVVVPSSVTRVEQYAFLGCETVVVYCEALLKPKKWEEKWDIVGSYLGETIRCPIVWDYKNSTEASDGALYTIVDGIRYKIKDGEAAVTRQIISTYVADIKETITYNDVKYAVRSIEDRAFSNCIILESVSLPSSLRSIGKRAFEYCEELEKLKIPSEVRTIGEYAFSQCESIKTIKIPSGVDVMSKGMLSGCTELSSLEIPSSVITIEEHAVGGCLFLESVTIPEGVVDIGNSAFVRCRNLRSVKIPSNVKFIGDRAFSYCSSLASVTIPEGVTDIGICAFAVNKSLESITIPSSVTSIGEDAFLECVSLVKIEVSENNSFYKSIDGNLYTKDGTALIRYAQNKTEKEFVIPDGVTRIEADAFDGAESLVSVVIPNSVTDIKEGAFSNCLDLERIIIPSSVTSMGRDVFNGCDILEIYCEAEEKPSGWNSYWNRSNCPVEWGYKQDN